MRDTTRLGLEGNRVGSYMFLVRAGMETIQETAEGEATSGAEDTAAASEPSGDAATLLLQRGLAAVKLEDGESASVQERSVSGGAELGGETDGAPVAGAASSSAAQLEADVTAASAVMGPGSGDAAPREDGAAGKGEASEEASEPALAPARSRRSSRAAVRVRLWTSGQGRVCAELRLTQ